MGRKFDHQSQEKFFSLAGFSVSGFHYIIRQLKNKSGKKFVAINSDIYSQST